MKKWLSVFLLFCLLFTSLQMTALAEEDDFEEDYYEEDYGEDFDDFFYDDEDYDDDYDEDDDDDDTTYTVTDDQPWDNPNTVDIVVPASTARVYAGATPIPIDPVDMPTATPRPELNFTFAEYTANNLGLTFSSAVGYEVNDTLSDLYVLTEPAAAMHDNYQCVITLQASSITRSYTTNDLKTDLKNYLSNESKKYTSFESAQAASTTLLGEKAYYNNYRGVLADGTVVRGRVCMGIIDRTRVLTLHVSAPAWFNTSYMKIFAQIKSTLKAK